MSKTETTNEKAKMVKRLEGCAITAEPPYWMGQFGSEEFKAERLESWVKEFNEFIRDHRSQDPVVLNVEREYKEVCSVCGDTWEPEDLEDGSVQCAACGAVIEEVSDGSP